MEDASSDDAVSSEERRHERLKVATCVVLVEIAMADDEFEPEERKHIISALQARFDLSEADAEELIELSTAEREKSRDLWSFTHLINEACSREEKMTIIDEVWRVVVADGTIDGHENHLAHQLGKLFNLTHGQLIESKMKVLKEVRGE
jgi:uncharacterized tellurite resistance protein B-like protein